MLPPGLVSEGETAVRQHHRVLYLLHCHPQGRSTGSHADCLRAECGLLRVQLALTHEHVPALHDPPDLHH